MKALQRIAKKGLKEPLQMLGKPVPDSGLSSTGDSRFQLLLEVPVPVMQVPGHVQEVLNFAKAL